jgi:SAM-dependent methyltransferase
MAGNHPVTRRDMLHVLIAGAMAAFSAGYPQFGFAADDGNFRAVYLDPALRARFFLFLKNVFHLYPEEDFDRLIARITRDGTSDRGIYEAILAELPAIKPILKDLRYALPALKKQKITMCDQTIALLGGKKRFGRYAEVGSTGRYYDRLSGSIEFSQPPVFIHTDQPSYQPKDIVERGHVRKIGSFLPLAGYQPLALPEDSIDVLTVYIGFHHSPPGRREEFVRSCFRVLKPGGSLIVRDHDVTDPSMVHFVALAHDVFNCGLELPWSTNAAEIRNFISLKELETILVATGFTSHDKRLLQEGDPTRNTLMRFDKA